MSHFKKIDAMNLIISLGRKANNSKELSDTSKILIPLEPLLHQKWISNLRLYQINDLSHLLYKPQPNNYTRIKEWILINGNFKFYNTNCLFTSWVDHTLAWRYQQEEEKSDQFWRVFKAEKKVFKLDEKSNLQIFYNRDYFPLITWRR